MRNRWALYRRRIREEAQRRREVHFPAPWKTFLESQSVTLPAQNNSESMEIVICTDSKLFNKLCFINSKYYFSYRFL